MEKLFSVLKRPSRLDDYGKEEPKGISWYFTSTRGAIKLLHAAGVTYTIIFCFLVCLSSVFLGLPLVFEDSPNALFIAQIVMVYIWICIESNFLLIRYRAQNSHVIQSSGVLPINRIGKSSLNDWRNANNSGRGENNGIPSSDWKKCSHCDFDVPPRARHCSICRTCVLKKDHHCFFTGCCVGFHNQRYFITFCVYGIIGGTWGLYNLGTYLSTFYYPILSLQIYNYFLPVCVVKTMLGYTSVVNFLLVFLFYLHITSTATSLYYFGWQMFIISRGQTSYECMKRKKVYAADFWSHMRSIFGRNWIIGFILPVPFIVNEGDGVHWDTHSKYS
mgnify:CR=1 FL=1